MAANLGSLDAQAALIALDREDVRVGGLSAFTRLAWHQVEPARYMSNWHVDLICEHLEAVNRCEILNLLIEVPPGCMKSLTTAVFFPSWAWIDDPGHKFIFSTYAQDLSDRDAKRHRDLVASAWFQDRWGDKCSIGAGQLQQVRMFETAQKGFRFSTSVGGVATGRHANTLVFDDPNRVQDAYAGSAGAGAAFDEAHTFWNVGMSTRRANPTTTRNVVIAQRLHDADVPGRLAEEGYELLRIPMRYDPKLVSIPRGVDPRAESGEEMLWPERFPDDDVAKLEVKLGPLHAAAQLQQNPAPESGALFSLDGFCYWDTLPEARGGQTILSVDCAFKGEATSDFVVLQAWLKAGARFYLLDQVRGQWTFTETCNALRLFAAKWPQAIAKLVEDKANGTAVIDTLSSTVSGLIPIEPEGGKQARAHATSPLYAAKNVYLPRPGPLYPWVNDYVQEHLRFPRGKNDDQVDCASQAINHLSNEPPVAYGYAPAKRDDGRHETRPVRSGQGWRSGGGVL